MGKDRVIGEIARNSLWNIWKEKARDYDCNLSSGKGLMGVCSAQTPWLAFISLTSPECFILNIFWAFQKHVPSPCVKAEPFWTHSITFWTDLRASSLQLHTALCWVLGRLQHPSGSGDSTQCGKKVKEDPDEELQVFWGFCIRLLSQMYTVWELGRSVVSNTHISTAPALAQAQCHSPVPHAAQSHHSLYPPLLPSEESCKVRCGFWETEATIGEEHLFISAGKWKFEDFSSECPNFWLESHWIHSAEDGWRHTWVKKFSQGISKFRSWQREEWECFDWSTDTHQHHRTHWRSVPKIMAITPSAAELLLSPLLLLVSSVQRSV